ncbi:MAG: hypothetical protein ACFB01_05090 [Cohaesibacteraceae bacterium]
MASAYHAALLSVSGGAPHRKRPRGEMVEDVIDLLAAFDGKHVAPLRTLARSNVPSRDLLRFLPGPHEVAASWVLKARVEGNGLDETIARSVFETLP